MDPRELKKIQIDIRRNIPPTKVRFSYMPASVFITFLLCFLCCQRKK